MTREKRLDAILVITTLFLVFYLIKKYEILLYLAAATGMIGIFIKPLAEWIAIVWYKIGDILGFIFPKVLLSLVFYLLLTPIAFFYKLSKNDPLKLKNPDQSNWEHREHQYAEDDFKNTW